MSTPSARLRLALHTTQRHGYDLDGCPLCAGFDVDALAKAATQGMVEVPGDRLDFTLHSVQGASARFTLLRVNSGKVDVFGPNGFLTDAADMAGAVAVMGDYERGARAARDDHEGGVYAGDAALAAAPGAYIAGYLGTWLVLDEGVDILRDEREAQSP